MKLKASFPVWVSGGPLVSAPVQTARSYAQSANRKPQNPEPKPNGKGRTAYVHYWTTHFKTHDRVPQPTLINSEHLTAPLHNLRARAHCLDHRFVRIHDNRRKTWTPAELEEANKKDIESWEEIRKRRRAALKLYRALNELEIEVYRGALEKSLLERVHKRPHSPEKSAGVTKEFIELLTPEMKASTWTVRDLAEPYSEGNSEPLNPKGKMLVKNYLFPDWDRAIAFMRVAMSTFELHDHHPTTVMQHRRENNMAEIKICSWTHAPRKLEDPIAPSSAPLPDISDREFDDITQEVPQNEQTRLSDNPPIARKTVSAEPTLTRKDFLLAWDLDGAEIQSRLKFEEHNRLRKSHEERRRNTTAAEPRPAVRAAKSELQEKGNANKQHLETATSQPSVTPVTMERQRKQRKDKESQQAKTHAEPEVTILRPVKAVSAPQPSNASNISDASAPTNEKRKNPSSRQRRSREAGAEKEAKAKAELVSIETPAVKLGESIGDVAVVAGRLEQARPDERQAEEPAVRTVKPAATQDEPIEQKVEPVKQEVGAVDRKVESAGTEAELEIPQVNVNTSTVISETEGKVSSPTPVPTQTASATVNESGEENSEKKKEDAETKA